MCYMITHLYGVCVCICVSPKSDFDIDDNFNESVYETVGDHPNSIPLIFLETVIKTWRTHKSVKKREADVVVRIGKNTQTYCLDHRENNRAFSYIAVRMWRKHRLSTDLLYRRPCSK
jgi:hypothetical protein